MRAYERHVWRSSKFTGMDHWASSAVILEAHIGLGPIFNALNSVFAHSPHFTALSSTVESHSPLGPGLNMHSVIHLHYSTYSVRTCNQWVILPLLHSRSVLYCTVSATVEERARLKMAPWGSILEPRNQEFLSLVWLKSSIMVQFSGALLTP